MCFILELILFSSSTEKDKRGSLFVFFSKFISVLAFFERARKYRSSILPYLAALRTLDVRRALGL